MQCPVHILRKTINLFLVIIVYIYRIKMEFSISVKRTCLDVRNFSYAIRIVDFNIDYTYSVSVIVSI